MAMDQLTDGKDESTLGDYADDSNGDSHDYQYDNYGVMHLALSHG
jgi:hypothetical protein